MHVFVLGRFPPPLDGQSMATERLAGLLEGGHAVHRLNTEPPPTGYVAAEVRFRPERVRHYLGLRGRLRKALREAPAAPVLWASLSPVPLGHWRDLLSTVPAFAPGQPVFGVVHRGNFDHLFTSAVTAPTARRLVRRLRGFVFLNEALAEACARWIPPEKRFVIPNTIDEAVGCTAAELAAKRRDRLQRSRLRLLFLSNMIATKGYLDVLRALPSLARRGVAVEAAFAGGWTSDEERRAFEREVEALGLSDIVVHHGAVTERARIKALHLRADVFLLPSSYPTEAQPLSILEALNAGTPVVATRHSGIPSIVRQDREALFVPPGDPEAIAEAVAQLDPPGRWEQLSEGARRRFEAEYSPGAVRDRWERLLHAHA